MAKISRFEELQVWQEAMVLCRLIHAECRSNLFREDRLLANQLWRASISVPSNIAEGFDRFSRPEFLRFLTIAKGSCAEVRCQLILAADVNLIAPEAANSLLAQAETVTALLNALRASLRRKGK